MKKTFQYNDATIAYRTEGTGEPVVLIHGFAEDSYIWDEQVDFLRNYCTLILPDLPGSGESIVNNKQLTANSDSASNIKLSTSNIGYYAACIFALLQHENISQCIMLGHSMGGYITLAFAKKYPQVLTGFGLIHSTAFADSEEKKETRRRGIKMMEDYGGYAFLKTTIPNLFSEKFKKEHPEKIDELIEKGKTFSKEVLQQYYAAMMNRPDSTGVLRGSNVPVLFVLGTEDVAAPLQDVLQQVHLPKTAYIHILENTGHMGMWEAKEEVNKYILDFVKAIAAY